MNAREINGALALTTDCTHIWRRARELEEELSTVVYVRSCVRCEQVEAKAGHKDPSNPEGWEVIEVRSRDELEPVVLG